MLNCWWVETKTKEKERKERERHHATYQYLPTLYDVNRMLNTYYCIYVCRYTKKGTRGTLLLLLHFKLLSISFNIGTTPITSIAFNHLRFAYKMKKNTSFHKRKPWHLIMSFMIQFHSILWTSQYVLANKTGQPHSTVQTLTKETFDEALNDPANGIWLLKFYG